MPNLVLEYTDNVEFDHKAFFKQLHLDLAQLEAINHKGLRSRAYRLTEYFMADGRAVYSVNINMWLKNSRTPEQLQAIKQILINALERTFGHYKAEGKFVSLSVYLREVTPEMSVMRHNIPPIK